MCSILQIKNQKHPLKIWSTSKSMFFSESHQYPWLHFKSTDISSVYICTNHVSASKFLTSSLARSFPPSPSLFANFTPDLLPHGLVVINKHHRSTFRSSVDLSSAHSLYTHSSHSSSNRLSLGNFGLENNVFTHSELLIAKDNFKDWENRIYNTEQWGAHHLNVRGS